MDTNELVPSLALFTFIAVVLAAVLGLLLFRRKRANRHPMAKAAEPAIATVSQDQTPADHPDRNDWPA